MPRRQRMHSVMNVWSRLKRAISRSGPISDSSKNEGRSFKAQLLNLSIYKEEVDSLFCVTVISNYLLSPKKGHPVRLFIDRHNLQVTWVDDDNHSSILCSHPLHTVTYQFHTNYKPRLYAYTAHWGRKKICLVFQTPRFSRVKGVTIRQHFDRMMQLHCGPDSDRLSETREPGAIPGKQGCSNLQLNTAESNENNSKSGKQELPARTFMPRKKKDLKQK